MIMPIRMQISHVFVLGFLQPAVHRRMRSGDKTRSGDVYSETQVLVTESK